MLLLFFVLIIVFAHLQKPYFEQKRRELEMKTGHHHKPPEEYLEFSRGGIRKHLSHPSHDERI